MKTTFSFLVTVLLLQTQNSVADDNTCEKGFGQAVAYCAQSLDFLSPNIRAGAQKACVQEAKLAKEACTSGVNLCLNACQTAYNNDVTTCEQIYDPSLFCGGSISCEQIVLQDRAACISAAVDALNACTISCPQ